MRIRSRRALPGGLARMPLDDVGTRLVQGSVPNCRGRPLVEARLDPVALLPELVGRHEHAPALDVSSCRRSVRRLQPQHPVDHGSLAPGLEPAPGKAAVFVADVDARFQPPAPRPLLTDAPRARAFLNAACQSGTGSASSVSGNAATSRLEASFWLATHAAGLLRDTTCQYRDPSFATLSSASDTSRRSRCSRPLLMRAAIRS